MKEIRENINRFYEESRRILQTAQDDKQLVLFVGAGTSIESGMPLWKDAVRQIASRLNIPEDEDIDVLRIPQYYYNSRGKKEYNQLMRKIFRAQDDLEITDIHKKLIDLNTNTIITTNYDHLLEKAAEEKAEVLQVISCDKELPYRKAGKELIKIHGDFEHDNFVLKEDDYLGYSRHFRLIENYIKSLIGTKVILLVGYSFGDPDVKQIFDWTKEVLKDDFQRAYLIDIASEYDPNVEEYYRNFGINILYASIHLPDFASLSYKKRLESMLDWIIKRDDQSALMQLYSDLKSLSFLNYAYGKYITRAFRKAHLNCDGGTIMYFDTNCPVESRKALNAIAYQLYKNDKDSCYVLKKNNNKERFALPDYFESKKSVEVSAIVDVLKKSRIDSIELHIQRDEKLPWLEDEIKYRDKHRVIIEIKAKDEPEWITAINTFNYRKLAEIEKYNDAHINENKIDLYMQQAYIAYFLRHYIKAYNLLRTYTKLQYKKGNYSEYFIAETCRVYVGRYIQQHCIFLGGNAEDAKEIGKEVAAINLERTLQSLPDMGNDDLFKDLYTFNFAYALFQESYRQSEKVREEANKTYSLFAGTPAFYQLRETISDFYNFEIYNGVILDEYIENRDIFKLYFSNILMSVVAPDKGKGDEVIGFDWNLPHGNIHADQLLPFDLYIAFRYMQVSDLNQCLETVHSNLTFSEATNEYIYKVIENCQYEPALTYGTKVFWKVICILSHSNLNDSLVDLILKVLNNIVVPSDYRTYKQEISRLLINIDNQGLLNEKNIKELYEFLNSEIAYMCNNSSEAAVHILLIRNLSYYCYKYKKPYNKVSYIRKMMASHLEDICLDCFHYFNDKIQAFIKNNYKEWKCDDSYQDFVIYCKLVDDDIFEPDIAIEEKIYKYCGTEHKKSEESGVVVNDSKESQLYSHILELYLKDKILDKKKCKLFVYEYGSEFHKWLFNPEKYDYTKFNVEWLNQCTRGLLKELSQNNSVKKQISHCLVKRYLSNKLPVKLVDDYFTYFS